jgi:hypothetical protein
MLLEQPPEQHEITAPDGTGDGESERVLRIEGQHGNRVADAGPGPGRSDADGIGRTLLYVQRAQLRRVFVRGPVTNAATCP